MLYGTASRQRGDWGVFVKRVLFVDDEAAILHGLKAGLYARRREWDMHFAQGGAKGIEMMRESHFDVLVTDMRMPGVDGTALVTRARADSPDTIRIVLSGYADEEQSLRLLSLAHRYLSKPCDPKRLEECIDRCFGTKSLIQSEELRVRLGSVGALPAMPATFAALQEALTDPKVDSSKVAAIIGKDPSVSAKVLQVCNSAFFRLPRRISSIQQAVSYLGLSSVRSMVLSAEVFRPGKSLPVKLDLGMLQRHALNVAAIARLLGNGKPWAEDAFLAGLLHDVGFLLLGRHWPVETQRAIEAASRGQSIVEAEREFIGVDHATAGAYLLGLWGLPYEVVDTVAHHEAPTDVPEGHFDIGSAMTIAHSLSLAVQPSNVPVFESGSNLLSDDYLRSHGIDQPWDSLVERASALLALDSNT